MVDPNKLLKNNEKGSALLWTLLISAVLTILALTLISFNVTQSKQNSKSETLVQEINLAEMGIIDFRNRIYSYLLGDPGPSSIEDITNWVTSNYVGQTFDEFIPETNNRFGYQVFNVDVNQVSESQLLITFKSSGITNSSSVGKTLTNIIDIQASSGGGGDPGSGGGGGDDPIGGGDGSDWGPGSGGDEESDWDIIEPTNPDTNTYDGNTLFEENVDLDQSGENVVVNGHAKFEQDLELSGYQSSVTIEKDGLFEGNTSLSWSETSIEVGGNAKFSQDFNVEGWKGTLSVGEDAIFGGDLNFSDTDSSILIEGGALFNGDITVSNRNDHSNNITVLKDAKFNGSITLKNYSTINVGGPVDGNACSANFYGPISLEGYQVGINVAGNAHFGSTINYVDRNAEMFIDVGDTAVFMDQIWVRGWLGSLTVNGDAYFATPPSIGNGSSITINGNLYMDGNTPNGMQVYGMKQPKSDFTGSLTGTYGCTSSGGSGWDISDDVQY
ncbi:hypothetical protein GCM10008967_25830 [Bacillus carboniphilus]|uniref:Type 4 fimbrial biogenesis protein PilX N-terminal domain-containing protein n=1 Tax=Bacillus carboniphilus TaxID=86663 RepID=A0ABN0WDL4_9BACI